MFGELCNQNVFWLFGADDVVVQLLIDVACSLCAFSEDKKKGLVLI